jgi:N-acetylmuramoyl-L-alanine amidase
MRKLVVTIASVLVMFFLFSVGTSHAADGQVRLYLNRTELIPEVPARIVEGNTLVPVRIISEEIGADVSWNQKEQMVTIEKNGLKIQLTINKTMASVNGIRHDLEVPPVLENGTTLLPVRFVTEKLGLVVQYDQLSAAVFLFEGGDSIPVNGGSGSEPSSVPAGATPKPTPTPASTPKPTPTVTPTPGASGSPAVSASPTGKPSGTPAPNASSTPKPGGSTATPEDGKGDGSIPAISHISLEGDVLKVTADGSKLMPVISRLANPERLIIDIPDAALAQTVNGKPAVQNGEIAVNHELAGKIRYALFMDKPSTVRIVVDLKQKIDYTLLESKNPGELSLSLKTKKFLVVLDAGHGDKDPGAISAKGRQEKDFNLSMILKLAKALEKDPLIQISLTRQDDTFLELDDRVKLANEQQADLFVSIHGNSFKTNTGISGTETYYSREDSKGLADVLHRHILEAAGFKDRNVRKNDLRVTKNTVMPAVLCEIGYMSNPQEELALFDEALQTRVAEAIAAGIREYLQIP